MVKITRLHSKASQKVNQTEGLKKKKKKKKN